MYYNCTAMKLIAQVKLKVTPEQADALKRTMRAVNAACNYISQYAWENKTFGRYALQKAIYYQAREEFGLSAQATVRAIAKVADTYKVDRKRQHKFKLFGAMVYDGRLLSWKTKDKQEVSTWSMGGRLHIPFVCGERQREMLEGRLGQADLTCRDGAFYLHQCCEVETPDPDGPDGWLGLDLGMVNLAYTSDGEAFSGEHLDERRRGYEHRRSVLQSVGTKSAKRRLRQISGRQARFQRDVNHCISKAIVERAARHHLGIALEDLRGITKTATVRRSQRSRHYNWPFRELEQFISYKARLAGVPVKFVVPEYTSQTCSVCGHRDKSNRRSRDEFVCSNCGHSAPADLNAARNIAQRASVSTPMVSTEGAKASTAGNCATA